MAVDDDRTYYEVLGVSPDASVVQLRDAHRQMALVLHPDRHTESSPAERRLADRRMKEVNVAWSVLSDPAKRAEYDRIRRARTVGQGGSAQGSPSSAPPSVSADDDWSDDGDWTDEDDVVVPHWQYLMFRRGPVVAMLVVAAIMFVASAYAGSSGKKAGGTDGVTETSVPKRECVSVTSTGRSAVRVPCSSENDGKIVTKVNAALDCPPLTTYVVMHDQFYCVSNDPAVVGSDSGG